MRQVPHYLLIGNGRLARHMRHYFSLLNLSFSSWYRQLPLDTLTAQLNKATHILLLINDHAIETFIQLHLQQIHAKLIHFSGSLTINVAYGAHPLMCFADEKYSLEAYQAIPFILDEHAPVIKELLPGLPNPHARLNSVLKAKYHALCVLSGNFSCLLWQKLFQSLEAECGLPKEMAYPYLQQQMQNLIKNPAHALTGPLTRQDNATLEKNLAALAGDPYQQVYASFILAHEKTRSNKT